MKELKEETYKFRLPFHFENFPIEIEDLPAGPLAIVSGILGGIIHLQLARYFPNIASPDQHDLILKLWVLFGGVLGIVGSVKVIFWLDDQIQRDRLDLQKRAANE